MNKSSSFQREVESAQSKLQEAFDALMATRDNWRVIDESRPLDISHIQMFYRASTCIQEALHECDEIILILDGAVEKVSYP